MKQVLGNPKKSVDAIGVVKLTKEIAGGKIYTKAQNSGRSGLEPGPSSDYGGNIQIFSPM